MTQAPAKEDLVTLPPDPIQLQRGQRQRQQGFDARAQDAVGIAEGRVDFRFRAAGQRRVIHAPVRTQHRAEIGRTGFAGGIGADGDDDIRRSRQVIPRFAVQAVCGNSFPRQQGQCARMHLAGGVTAGTHRPPAVRRQLFENRLAQDGTARVAGTQKKYVHDSTPGSVRGKSGSTAGAQQELARSAAHCSGWPAQHSSVR